MSERIEKLFIELRREGHNFKPASSETIEKTAQNLLTDSHLSENDKQKVAKDLELSHQHDGDLDNPTIYALMTLKSRAAERNEAVEKYYEHIATQSESTVEKIRSQFVKERNIAKKSKPLSSVFNERTRYTAVLLNLPYDGSSIVAFENLKAATRPAQHRVA